MHMYAIYIVHRFLDNAVDNAFIYGYIHTHA
jgi:hypothetical protein